MKGAVRAADREGSLGRGDQLLSKPAVVHTESKLCFVGRPSFYTGAGLSSFFFCLHSSSLIIPDGLDGSSPRFPSQCGPIEHSLWPGYILFVINVLSPRTLVDVHAVFLICKLIGRSGIYAL